MFPGIKILWKLKKIEDLYKEFNFNLKVYRKPYICKPYRVIKLQTS